MLKRANSLFLLCEISSAVLKTWKTMETPLVPYTNVLLQQPLGSWKAEFCIKEKVAVKRTGENTLPGRGGGISHHDKIFWWILMKIEKYFWTPYKASTQKLILFDIECAIKDQGSRVSLGCHCCISFSGFFFQHPESGFLQFSEKNERIFKFQWQRE